MITVNNRHPLGRLISTVQEAKGWSERQLEEQAAGRPGLGKSNISKIKNHPIISIKGTVIKGLSELLSIPEERVARAALESMGVEITGQQSLTLGEAVQHEAALSQRDRKLLLGMLREMYRMPDVPAMATQDDHELAARIEDTDIAHDQIEEQT